MARGKTTTVVFKRNLQGQTMLLPPDLGELIAKDHPVRIVNDILDRVDITELLRQYRPGGTSSYPPRMLLKVLVYSYINNLYSSRRIEEAVTQNIHYMWLAGMSRPDHNTINRFRGKRLQGCLRPIFTQVSVDFVVRFALELPLKWVSSDYNAKQRIQLFSANYNKKEKRHTRTWTGFCLFFHFGRGNFTNVELFSRS